jgi:hypothetical protein
MERLGRVPSGLRIFTHGFPDTVRIAGLKKTIQYEKN